MLYKAVLLVHFLAMIGLVGGAAAVSVILAQASQSEPADRSAYGRVITWMNQWLFAPGLAVAPIAGLWLWSQHNWVFPTWLKYKLGLTMLGIVGAAMYLHLFRSELGPLLANRISLEEGTGDATSSCRRVVAVAGSLLLAAAVIGTLKPGW